MTGKYFYYALKTGNANSIFDVSGLDIQQTEDEVGQCEFTVPFHKTIASADYMFIVKLLIGPLQFAAQQKIS